MLYEFSLAGAADLAPSPVPVKCRGPGHARLRALELLSKYPLFQRVIVRQGGTELFKVERDA